MLRRWWQAMERRRRARAAASLHEWRASLAVVLETCSHVLHVLERGADIGVTLDRVDRELMRFRNHAAEIRPRLRRASPTLAERVRRATDDTFRLRNRTHAYLLRWKARQQAGASSSEGLRALREMEEAQLRASEVAQRLRSDVAAFLSELQALIDSWEGER
jgi:hypothetical protein